MRQAFALVFFGGLIGAILAPPGLVGAQVRPAATGSAPANRQATSSGASGVSRAALQAPKVIRFAVPEIPGQFAIFGATGRDPAGGIWFAVCAHKIKEPSAHLFEFVPRTGEVTDRGDVVSELKRAGLHRAGEGQMKIHSRIVQPGDGHLYFASMDEEGEDQASEKPPVWGSHLWRVRLPERKWEHLLAAPEGLIAAAGGAGKVYALGYWGHKLYQYDCATGKTRSVEVGSYGGHVSRNILCDRRGHAYVPRVARTETGKPVATLVEYDAALNELARTPLKDYLRNGLIGSHGIIGLADLPDGSVAFLTHIGLLYLVRPPKALGTAPGGADPTTRPAAVEEIGLFHPQGESYAASLFADSAGRLVGVAGRAGRFDWVTYDLKTESSSAVEFKISQPQSFSLRNAMLYGSITRDDAGNFYIGGGEHLAGGGYLPLVLQVQPAK